jgi:hypothetical protein
LCYETIDNRISGPSKGVQINSNATCGFSEKCDPLRVSAKSQDIISHPFYCHSLIKQANILVNYSWSSWKTKDVQAVASSQ